MNSISVFCLVLLCRLAVSAPVNTVSSSTTPVQSTTGVMSNTHLPQSTITSQQPTTSQVNQPRDLSGQQQSSQQVTSPQQVTSQLTNDQVAAQGPMMRSPPTLSPQDAQARSNAEVLDMFASMLKPRIMGADGAAAEATQHNQQQQVPEVRQTMAVPPQNFGQQQLYPQTMNQGFLPPQQQQFIPQQPYNGLQQAAFAPQPYQQVNPYGQQQVLPARSLALPVNQGYYPVGGVQPLYNNPAVLYARSADVSPQVQQLPQQPNSFNQQPLSNVANQQIPQQSFPQVPQQSANNLNTPAVGNTGFVSPQSGFNNGVANNQFIPNQFQNQG